MYNSAQFQGCALRLTKHGSMYLANLAILGKFLCLLAFFMKFGPVVSLLHFSRQDNNFLCNISDPDHPEQLKTSYGKLYPSVSTTSPKGEHSNFKHDINLL